MSEKNSPIGTVTCPWPGCGATCNVYKFRKRAGEEKLTRFGGKLYADCPTHGRIGADAREATQEYLLSNAKMHPPKNGGGAGEAPAPQKAAPVNGSSSAPATARPSTSKASSSSMPPAPATPVKRPWWAPVIE